MSCCGPRCGKRPEISKRGYVWKFTNGTTVISDSFENAVYELHILKPNQFWASETHEGTWDVQLSDSVIVYNIAASSVLEAVKIARWKAHLDKSFKSIDTTNE